MRSTMRSLCVPWSLSPPASLRYDERERRHRDQSEAAHPHAWSPAWFPIALCPASPDPAQPVAGSSSPPAHAEMPANGVAGQAAGPWSSPLVKRAPYDECVRLDDGLVSGA
jgi:hypothetical protein